MIDDFIAQIISLNKKSGTRHTLLRDFAPRYNYATKSEQQGYYMFRRLTTQPTHYRLLAILVLALAARLIYGLAQDHRAVYELTGGDSGWYLRNGYALITNIEETGKGGVDLSRLPTAPLYLVFNGIVQVLFNRGEASVIVMRILQALASVATIIFAYKIVCLIADDEGAALLTAGVLAISPPFVIEATNIQTETLYIFFLTAGLWVYIRTLKADAMPQRTMLAWMAGAGLLLGLATLTRAVLILFPLGLVAHLVLLYGWRLGLRRGVVLFAVYAFAVSTWTIYNLARWNRLVIGAEGYASFLYIGTVGWQGGAVLDQSLPTDVPDFVPAEDEFRLDDDVFIEGFSQNVTSDPAGYVQRRVTELADAYTQPYGTIFFHGASLKALASNWLQNDRSLGGLSRLVQAQSFWPKLSIWLLHGVGIVAGIAGMWLMRHRWRLASPLVGFIVYTSLVHLALTALPRYIFPTELFWWAFAAIALVQAVQWLQRKVEKPETISQPPSTMPEHTV